MTVPEMPDGDTQRRVFHVGGLFTEDGAKEFFFRRQLRLTLRSDLADQYVAGFHFRTDVYNAGFVQATQHALGQIGNVACDFFGPNGIARTTDNSSM